MTSLASGPLAALPACLRGRSVSTFPLGPDASARRAASTVLASLASLTLALAGLTLATAIQAQAIEPASAAGTPAEQLAQLTTLPPPSAQLERVVVTATRSPQRVDDSLAAVTVIDRAQLDAAAGRTLAELLSREAGVQLEAAGGPGAVSALRIRGLETRHTVLLIDGVRHGIATSTGVSWQNLSLESIERIEIVRGPLSSLYGADAAGGVVQIFTRAAGTGASGVVLGHAVVGAGSRRSGQLGAGLRLTQDEVDLALNAERSRTDGFSASNARADAFTFNPDADPYRRDAAGARWVWRMAPGWRTEINGQWSDGDVHYDDGPGGDTVARAVMQLGSVQFVGQPLPAWRSVLRLSHSGDDFDTLQGSFPGNFATVQRQATWENTLSLPTGTALAVIERTEQRVDKSDTAYEVNRRRIDGMALGWNGRIEALTWQTSVRHDRNSQFGSATTGNFGLGADANEVWRLGASVGSSYTVPDFNRLYFPGFSNPALQPERGSHLEVYARALVPYGSWRIAYFDNRVRGFITAGTAPQNLPRIRSRGWSVGGEAALAAWRLKADLDWLDPRNVSVGSANEGQLLPRRAQRTAQLAADWRGGDLSAGVALAAASQRVEYAFSGETLRMGGYATVDLSLGWQLAREWALALRLNNAADRDYETAYGFNQPAREAFVTLRYEAR